MADLIDIFEGLTVLFGLFCCGVSLWLAGYFYHLRERIARGIAIMMGGEFFVLGMTTVFATFAWNNTLENIPHSSQMLMRWVMYGVASGTSLHLYKQIRKVERGEE